MKPALPKQRTKLMISGFVSVQRCLIIIIFFFFIIIIL